jgi:catechol 2,3-dioxygenase-like lactoylglutathione lyase family enzyme
MTHASIKGLGEIALRIGDLNAMQRFYQDAIGLTLMKRFEKAAFFRIAEGYGGHTQVLALFDRSDDAGSPPLKAAATTVDHLAFEIAREDFDFHKRRLEELGLNVETTVHPWVHWRSLYVRDPDGNQVEFVCYDETVT